MIFCGWTFDKFFPDEILIQGHGEQGEGHDLVCAAVSSAVYSCLNSLEKPQNFSIRTKKGLCKIVADVYPGKHDQRLLCVLLATMMQIAEKYPNQVRVYEIQK